MTVELTTTPRVRDATVADLPAVAAIYTHYVLRTTVTFNTEVRTPREWTDRFETQVVHGPYHLLVADLDGHVAGYAELKKLTDLPVGVHEADARRLPGKPDFLLGDGD